MPSSIFARLVEKLPSLGGEIFPFHLGDTHLDPPPEACLHRIAWDDRGPSLYRYAPPSGDPVLLAAIVAKLSRKNGMQVSTSHVQVTAGATHAFACATRALLDEGDEVLILSPFWPLARGIVLSVGARPVEVPFSTELYSNPSVDPRALIRPFITDRTAAIYLINPNNPDGKVLGQAELAAVADLARHHGLWVLSDEVYEDFIFDGRSHLSIATLPGMDERTITVFSFSKSYAQAGLRVGYLVGPESAIAAIRKLANHSIYNVPRAMQRSALAALVHGEKFLASARDEYVRARDLAVAKLGIPCRVPEAGTYLFVDLAGALRGSEQVIDLLERLAAEGILLAPGEAFGAAHATWARLCYTAVPREKLGVGLEKMGKLLAKG